MDQIRGRTALFATMHGKESVVAPLFKQELGVDVIVPTDFNTDQFGTFTGDIPRAGNQLEAARNKARAAMKQYGYDLGIASEGSIGPHPDIPFAQLSIEIIVLIDAVHDTEYIGTAYSSMVEAREASVHSEEEAVNTALSWGFPQQGIVIRRKRGDTKHVFKQIETIEDIRHAVQKAQSAHPFFIRLWHLLRDSSPTISIETDMRAHKHPTRMECIKAATIDLIEQCKSRTK